MTYHQAGSLQPRSSGITSHTRWVTSWIAVWKRTAANATGTPSSAASTSVRTYAVASASRMGEDPTAANAAPQRASLAARLRREQRQRPAARTHDLRGLSLPLVPCRRRCRRQPQRNVVGLEERAHALVLARLGGEVARVHELDEWSGGRRANDLDHPGDRCPAHLVARPGVVQHERRPRIGLEVTRSEE